MVLIPKRCPFCGSCEIIKFGTDDKGKQRYKCLNQSCVHTTFVENYVYLAYDPEIIRKIYEMTVNGSGTRAIARVLGISKDTVTAVLRRIESLIFQVNYDYIDAHKNSTIEIEFVPVQEVEMDEMWSFVHDKSQQYWLWWAIDHQTGDVLAYTFGTREHKYLDELISLLEPFDIKIVYADGNYAYTSHITDSVVVTGKTNTQKIERKHLSLRTWCSRLVRKGIRFSKNHQMHRIVIGLIINVWFFGRILW
jgi:IS1 family transposase